MPLNASKMIWNDMLSHGRSISPIQGLLLAGILAFLIHHLYATRNNSAPRKTFSIHPLAPPFISGAYAAYQLGINETDFLSFLQGKYGSAVYLPFPIGQHFVLSDKLVRKIYSGKYNNQLSFIPIRKKLSTVIFGMSSKITDLQGDQLDKHIFPVHSKGMTKPRLASAVDRFYQSITETIALEKQEWKGDKTIDAVDWTFTLMFKASMAALFGDQLDIPLPTFIKCFQDFDRAFPLLASEQIPKFIQPYFPSVVAQGVKSRDWLNVQFGKWARETGCAGLDDGDVVKAMAMEGIKLGFSDYDNGSGILGDFWALLANNPFAVSWIVIYLVQAEKQLLEDVMAEIDAVDLSSTAPAQADTPLLTSVIFETLRLRSSSYSIRLASPMNEIAVHVADEDAGVEGTFVRPGEKIVCAVRAGHLDTSVWGENARVWDGRRFCDDPNAVTNGDLGTSKSRRMPEVRAFGGGVSICEGRNLAVAELKTFLIPVLQSFRFFTTTETMKKSEDSSPLDRLPCVGGYEALAPKESSGRPGLGMFQLNSAMFMKMSMR